MSTDGAIIPCGTCGHTTPINGVCVACKPTPQAVCIGCAYRGPRPAEAEPAPGAIASGMRLADDDLSFVVSGGSGGEISPTIDPHESPLVTWGGSADHVSFGAQAEPGVGKLSLRVSGVGTRDIERLLKVAIEAIKGQLKGA